MGAVKDVHGTESFDLVCQTTNSAKHVEVKGTTTAGAEVLLTPNEVEHARRYPDVALFILADIVVKRDTDGTVSASGGRRVVFDPWVIGLGTLTPVGYRYAVP